ncbi:MAG: hypothetical protein JWN29_2401 [Acidimicrobiales bacterium]|nr:hypothetical protein [Acidimicrobiales bacterium]
MNKQIVRFTSDDVGPVLAALDPRGWVNLQPDVEDAPPPPPPGWFGSVFSNRGPALPLATWYPGERSAGIEHNTGPKLASRIDVPVGWRVTQDHPRRGLVVRVPAEIADAEVLRWLVDLGEALSAVPTSGQWIAEIHTP